MTDDQPTRTPTGRRAERDGAQLVVLERTFRAPIDDVWAAVTEPERLERWIGTWDGDPSTGTVGFRMTAEGRKVAAAEAERLARQLATARHRKVLRRSEG